MFNFGVFRYGDFFYNCYITSYNFTVEISLKRTAGYSDISINKIKFKSEIKNFIDTIVFFFDSDNVKRVKRRNRKIYKLLKERKRVTNIQDELRENEEFISHLPEERQKQIYRTAKLERITK